MFFVVNTYSIVVKMGFYVFNFVFDIVFDELVAFFVIVYLFVVFNVEDVSKEFKKKKYVKEMWFGKKSVYFFFV